MVQLWSFSLLVSCYDYDRHTRFVVATCSSSKPEQYSTSMVTALCPKNVRGAHRILNVLAWREHIWCIRASCDTPGTDAGYLVEFSKRRLSCSKHDPAIRRRAKVHNVLAAGRSQDRPCRRVNEVRCAKAGTRLGTASCFMSVIDE
jgi:hypothetical protein